MYGALAIVSPFPSMLSVFTTRERIFLKPYNQNRVPFLYRTSGTRAGQMTIITNTKIPLPCAGPELDSSLVLQPVLCCVLYLQGLTQHL